MALTRIKGSNIADGTVVEADIADNSVTATKLDATLDLSSKSVTLPSASVTAHATNPTKSSIEALGIDVPATDLTGTIPDARFPATLPAIDGSSLTNLPAGGKVLQVSSSSLGGSGLETSSATYSDMCTVTITPTSSSNKVVIFASNAQSYAISNNPNGNIKVHSDLGSTDLGYLCKYQNQQNPGYVGGGTISVEQSLSTWTSGSITFRLQGSSSNNVYIQHAAYGLATLTVMEISS